jgi:hypothetical protein
VKHGGEERLNNAAMLQCCDAAPDPQILPSIKRNYLQLEAAIIYTLHEPSCRTSLPTLSCEGQICSLVRGSFRLSLHWAGSSFLAAPHENFARETTTQILLNTSPASHHITSPTTADVLAIEAFSHPARLILLLSS